jgi:hypothetical protein
MIQKLKVPVTVETVYDHRKRSVGPVRVFFDGREHKVLRTGYHHTFRAGRTLFHVFSVASESTFFRLVLNTDNLFWELEEISDGEAD